MLAYAHSGKFVLKELPDGPKAWVEGVTAVIQKALVKLSKPEEIVESRWKYIEKTGGISQALPGGRIADGNCSSYDQYMHQCPAGTFYNPDCSGSSPVCQESAFLFYSLKWGHANNYELMVGMV